MIFQIIAGDCLVLNNQEKSSTANDREGYSSQYLEKKKEFLVVDELVLASILMFCVRHGLIKHLNCYCYFS